MLRQPLEPTPEAPSGRLHRGISRIDAATHTVRGNLGPGCLALPYAFAQCRGWVDGIVTLVLTVAQGVYCMQVLASCERLLWQERCEQFAASMGTPGSNLDSRASIAPPQRLSLGETVKSCLGGWARCVVETSVFIVQAGVCCVYISLVAENITALSRWPLARSGTILAIAPLFFSLGQINVVSSAALSHFGNAVMALVVVSTTACAFAVIVHDETERQRDSGAGGRGSSGYGDGDSIGSIDSQAWLAVINLAATTFYAFEGIGLVLPVANAMANPMEFASAMQFASAILALCYSSVGASCGEAFRSRSLGSGSITAFLAKRARDLPPLVQMAPELQTLNMLVTVAVISTFALQILPSAQVLHTWCVGDGGDAGGYCANGETGAMSVNAVLGEDDKLLLSRSETDSPASAGPLEGGIAPSMSRSQRAQRLALVAACVAITVAVPSVGLLVSLFGSVGVTVLAAAAPACRLALMRRGMGDRHIARVFADVCVMAFCAVVMVLGTTSALSDIVAAYR